MITSGSPIQVWPTKYDYDQAILKWTQTIWDAEIRSGKLAQDNMGICRFGGANLYVSIYKIGNWMVRCFCSNPPYQVPADIRERYIAINRFSWTNYGRVSALIPVIYIENGITVDQRTFPIVKMPFLEGALPLGEFLAEHYHEHATMLRLSDAWLRMIRELEAVSMAHGDLDLTNVLVEERNSYLTLKLIDYDNIWIPELAGHRQTEHGHAAFQHPNFLPPRHRPYNAEMDRFSALVIYISLKMLTTHPELYEQWGADESERLLLSESDYQNAGLVGSRVMQLRQLADQDLIPYIHELNTSLRESRMPQSLDTIAQAQLQSSQFLRALSTTFALPQKPIIQPPAVAMWQNAVYTTNSANPWPSSPQTTTNSSSTSFAGSRVLPMPSPKLYQPYEEHGKILRLPQGPKGSFQSWAASAPPVSSYTGLPSTPIPPTIGNVHLWPTTSVQPMKRKMSIPAIIAMCLLILIIATIAAFILIAHPSHLFGSSIGTVHTFVHSLLIHYVTAAPLSQMWSFLIIACRLPFIPVTSEAKRASLVQATPLQGGTYVTT